MSDQDQQTKLSRRTVRVRIEGRVQGVGYRMFVKREADARGVRGMVRNRRDGGVEAVFAGTSECVDDMIECCRRGPRGAAVQFLKVLDEPAIDQSDFVIAPTV